MATQTRQQPGLTTFNVAMQTKLRDEAKDYCRQRGTSLSLLIRQLLAKKIGMPELAEMPRGVGEKTS